MRKKLFAIFLIFAVLSFTAAFAAEKKPEDVKSTFKYTDDEDNSIEYDFDALDSSLEENITLDDGAGTNFQAIYTLPNLGLTVTHKFSDLDDITYEDPSKDIVNDYVFSGDKLAYKWEIKGPTVNGQSLENANLSCALSKNASGDILVISGILPDLADKTKINYQLVATVTGIVSKDLTFVPSDSSANYALANKNLLTVIAEHAVGVSYDETIEISVSANEDTSYTYITQTENKTSFDKLITVAEGSELSSVTADSYVTVAIPTEQKTSTILGTLTVPLHLIPLYEETNESGDVISQLPEDILLPSWLKVANVHTITIDDTAYIDSFDIVPNGTTSVKGAKAVIRFPLLDASGESSKDNPLLVQWETASNLSSSLTSTTAESSGEGTYTPGEGDDDENKPTEADSTPFGISGESEVSFTLTPGVSQNKTAAYSGYLPISKYEISKGTLDSNITLNVEYTTFTFKKDTKQQGTITLTASVPENYTSSNNNPYSEGSVIFYNQYNKSFDIKVGVTINTSAAFSLSPVPENLTLTAGGSAKTVTITASGVSSGLTWKYNANNSGLTISQSSSTGNSVTYSITAPSTVSAGDYKILVTGTYNGENNSVYVPVTVQSNSGGGSGSDSTNFTLSASPSYINSVIGGQAQTVTITASGSTIQSWTQTSENSGLDVSITKKNNSATVSIAANSSATAGSQTLKITATDSNGTSKTVDITVIVSKTELDKYSEYVLNIQANAEDIIKAYKNSGNKNISDDVTVAVLSSDNFDEETSDVDDFADYLAALDPSEVPVIPLNGIPSELIEGSQLYVFPISYDVIKAAVEESQIIVGEKFLVHVFSMAIDDEGNVSDTLSDDITGIFVDNSGKQITTVPDSASAASGINVAAYIPENGEIIDYWPVISKYKIALVSADKENLTLAASGSTTVKLTANKNVTSWNVSTSDSGILASVQNAKDETAEVLVTVLPTTELGDYNVVVTAADVDGTEISKDIALKVVDSSQVLTLTANTTSINLIAGGAARTVTVTAGGNTTNLTWNVKDSAGLTVTDSTAGAATQHQYLIGAPSSTTAGTYSVIIEAANGSETASLTINAIVTVNSSSSGNTGTDEQTKQEFLANNSGVAKNAISEITEETLNSLKSQRNDLVTFASNNDIAILSRDAFSDTSRTINGISTAEKNYFNVVSEEPILALPLIKKGTITEAKVYVFAVNIYEQIDAAFKANMLDHSSLLFIRITPVASDSTETVSIAADATTGKFFNDNGTELKKATDVYALGSSNINVAANLESDTDYSLVVTAKSETQTSTVGPSGAGCITGSAIGIIAMILASGIFQIRRKAKKNKI